MVTFGMLNHDNQSRRLLDLLEGGIDVLDLSVIGSVTRQLGRQHSAYLESAAELTL